MNHGGMKMKMKCEGGPRDGELIFVAPGCRYVEIPVVGTGLPVLSDEGRHPSDETFEVFTYVAARRVRVEDGVMYSRWVLVPA